jgi:hypothetical protein
MAALRAGSPAAAADPAALRFMHAATHDPDVYRAMLEMVFCLAPPEDVLSRPAVREKVQQAPAEAPPVVPGPDRRRLEELLAA